MATDTDIKKELEEDVKSLLPLQNELMELEQTPEVVKYLGAVKKFKDRESSIRLTIQNQMEKHGIKNIKGEWGYMTIVERNNYKAINIDEVPPRFLKKSLDTTKVSSYAKLHDKLPIGVESNPTRSLTIKLKVKDEE